MTTLIHSLRSRNKRYGLQRISEGCGMANLTVLERL